MRRRRLFVFAALTALVCLAVAFVLPGAFWKVHGWRRGEPFWNGYPASYYAERVRRLYRRPPYLIPRGSILQPCDNLAEQLVRRTLGHWTGDLIWDDHIPMKDMDAAAMAVLEAIAREPDTNLKHFAVYHLSCMGVSAAPALRRLLDSGGLDIPQTDLRQRAEIALVQMGQDAAGRR
jgi:hypothetical protein